MDTRIHTDSSFENNDSIKKPSHHDLNLQFDIDDIASLGYAKVSKQWLIKFSFISYSVALAVLFFAVFSPPHIELSILWGKYFFQLVVAFLLAGVFLVFAHRRKCFFYVDKRFAVFSIIASIIIACSHIQIFIVIVSSGVKFLLDILQKYLYVPSFWENLLTYILVFCGVLSVSIVFSVFLYCLYRNFYCYIKKRIIVLNTEEKIFLLLMWVLFSGLIIFAYMKSNVFYNSSLLYNLIYTSDTGALYTNNSWMVLNDSQNDIRQPLFALFAAPFCVFPYFISKILFFIPNSYAYLLAILQAFLILFSFLTLAKIICSSDKKNLILFFIIFSTSFPAFLFILNMEQYAFALFWLVIFIHAFLSKKISEQWKKFFLLAAAGSITTSWILIVTLWKNHKIKESIQDSLKLILIFIVLCIIYFRLNILTTAFDVLDFLLQYSSLTKANAEICSFYNRICQFSSFVYSCLFAPESSVVSTKFFSYQLNRISTIHIWGCVLFFIANFGFILNRKQKIAQISFLWVLLSIFLLLICGYGAPENGMVLYTLYFSWAYYILIYLALTRLIPACKYIRYTLMTGVITLQLAVNIPAVIKIIQFGIEYYPNK